MNDVDEKGITFLQLLDRYISVFVSPKNSTKWFLDFVEHFFSLPLQSLILATMLHMFCTDILEHLKWGSICISGRFISLPPTTKCQTPLDLNMILLTV